MQTYDSAFFASFNACFDSPFAEAGNSPVIPIADQLFPTGEPFLLMDANQIYTMLQFLNFFRVEVGADLDPVAAWMDTRLWGGKTLDEVLEDEAELITNGDFNSASGWTLGTDWSIAGGVASKTPGTATALEQTLGPLISGGIYQITISIGNSAGGNLDIQLGSSTIQVSATGNLELQFMVLVPGDNNDLSITSDVTFDGDLLDISVKQVPGFHYTQLNVLNNATYRDSGGLFWVAGNGINARLETGSYSADGDILITAAVDGGLNGTWFDFYNDDQPLEKIAITEKEVEVRADSGETLQTISLTLSGDHVISVTADEGSRVVEAFVDGSSVGSVTATGTAWFDTTSTNKRASLLTDSTQSNFSDASIYWITAPVYAGAPANRTIAEAAALEKITP